MTRIYMAQFFTGLFLCIGLCMSCSNARNAEQYLEAFERDQGRFGIMLERNDVRVKVLYIPGEYFLAREMAFDTTAAPLHNRYDKSLFIRVSLLPKDGNDRGAAIIQGTRHTIQKNGISPQGRFFITCGRDTIAASSVEMDQAMHNADELAMMTVFDKSKTAGKMEHALLHIRNICDEVGTLEVPLRKIVKTAMTLKG